MHKTYLSMFYQFPWKPCLWYFPWVGPHLCPWNINFNNSISSDCTCLIMSLFCPDFDWAVHKAQNWYWFLRYAEDRFYRHLVLMVVDGLTHFEYHVLFFTCRMTTSKKLLRNFTHSFMFIIPHRSSDFMGYEAESWYMHPSSFQCSTAGPEGHRDSRSWAGQPHTTTARRVASPVLPREAPREDAEDPFSKLHESFLSLLLHLPISIL